MHRKQTVQAFMVPMQASDYFFCAQVLDGDWFCAFNPDPAYQSCSIPEQVLKNDGDSDGELAILHAPGFVPAGSGGNAAQPDNVAFFRLLLQQRAGGNTAVPVAAAWWLTTDAAVAVSHSCQVIAPRRGLRPAALLSVAQPAGKCLSPFLRSRTHLDLLEDRTALSSNGSEAARRPIVDRAESVRFLHRTLWRLERARSCRPRCGARISSGPPRRTPCTRGSSQPSASSA